MPVEERKGLPDELRELAGDLEEGVVMALFPCVYFLILNGAVVYVGQTENLCARTGFHLECKEFDSIWFIRVPQESLYSIERHWITKLRPPLNGEYAVGRRNTKHEPIDREVLLQRIDACRKLDEAGIDSVLSVNLNVVTAHRLLMAGIDRVEALRAISDVDLLSIHGIGDASLRSIREALGGA